MSLSTTNNSSRLSSKVKTIKVYKKPSVFSQFLCVCNAAKTKAPKKLTNNSARIESKPKRQRHSSLLDGSVWDVRDEFNELQIDKPDLAKDYSFIVNKSMNIVPSTTNFESLIPPHLEPVTEGYLPPSEIIIEGEESFDGPYVEVQRNQHDQYDFLYDSEVGTKFRGTTYYKPKRWTK